MKALAVALVGLISWAGGAAAQQQPAAAAAPEPTPAWNTWIDGRFVGVVDHASNQQSFGSYTTLGADKAVSPWLTLGLGVGYEHFVTQSWALPDVSSTENGVGLQPYATARLSPNFFLTAFGAVTRVFYNASLGSSGGAQFDAWRWLGGGNLMGVWHDGNWRLQPTLTVLYGQENQDGYTTTTGATVAPQTLPFGRISFGPEVGYAFRKPEAWAIEPFVFARGNYDYVQPNVAVFNGAIFSSAQHGPLSASLGGGLSFNTKQGFYLRLQGSNESVGQGGFDVWLAQVRGGWKFN
jgi:outer membrane autotransporter protein